MPYAFAHPAAVVPVAKLLGRRAVPSALAIGSMIPDAWYLVPGLERGHSHDPLGLLWFCLPAGLVMYLAFHILFKQPMLALLPDSIGARLSGRTTRGLPPRPWLWVLLSLLAGAGTHLLWDALTHEDGVTLVNAGVYLHRVLQHASTIAGTAFLGWWIWRKLRTAQTQAAVPQLDRRVRAAVVAVLFLVPWCVFASMLLAFDSQSLRAALRAAGVTAFSTFGLIALVYSIAWRRRRP